LRTIPGSDAALVLNVGTGDASVVRVVDDNEPTARRLPIVKGANAIEVAPDGAHAVVFFDADASIAGDDFGDFQSVSVVDLTSGAETSVNMSVGFKPERVVFQADGKRAFVLTERAISVLDFGDIAASGAGIAP
jgi:DNA-binding beta-propeller fold protein YncE